MKPTAFTARPQRRPARPAGRLFLLFLVVTLLASCGTPSAPEPPPTLAPTATTAPATATDVPTKPPPTVRPTTAPATATSTTAPTATSESATITPLPPAPTAAPAAVAVTNTAAVTTTAAVTPTVVPTRDPNAPRPLDQTFNILLMGSDQRPGERAWRTDTIMIAAVDFPNKRIGLVSLPRDLWLDIPGYGMSRINMADFVGEYEIEYPGGGPALLQQVISNTFDIPIQRYARMNLLAFEKAIDTIGGVTVNLDCPLLEATPDPRNPDKLNEVFYDVGPHHFNGREARLYASYRYYTGDWDRSRRQQQVLMAIRDQALQFNMITKVPELWVTFRDAFQTDLTLKEVLDLATFGLLQMDMKDVHGVVVDYRLVTPYRTPGGGAVLLPKIPEINQAVDNIFTLAPLRETAAQPVAGCRTPSRATATPVPTATPTAVPPPED